MKFLVGLAAFFGTFVVYDFISCQIFPVDENNSFQAPDAYYALGLLACALAAYFAVKAYSRRSSTRRRSKTNKTTSSTYHIPEYLTPKEYASKLLASSRSYVRECNVSSTVFDFSFSFKKLISLIDELIWLNEKKRVSMHPTPRSELNKLHQNISSTIDDFISRATTAFPASGRDRAVKIELFVLDLESNEVFQKILTDSNRRRLQQLREEAAEIRQDELLKQIGFEPNLNFSDFDAIKVIVSIEQHLFDLYRRYVFEGLSPAKGAELFLNFKNCCKTSSLPLAAEVRLNALMDEYAPKFSEQNVMNAVDNMDGHDFELWCANLLSKNGFSNVTVTPGSGDHGVDVLAEKDGIHYAIQCKCYSHDLGNTPVQEVYAGKEMYRCQVGVVMTNRYFTAGAKQLAEQTRVLLWDRDKLQSLIESAE